MRGRPKDGNVYVDWFPASSFLYPPVKSTELLSLKALKGVDIWKFVHTSFDMLPSKDETRPPHLDMACRYPFLTGRMGQNGNVRVPGLSQKRCCTYLLSSLPDHWLLGRYILCCGYS